MPASQVEGHRQRAAADGDPLPQGSLRNLPGVDCHGGQLERDGAHGHNERYGAHQRRLPVADSSAGRDATAHHGLPSLQTEVEAHSQQCRQRERSQGCDSNGALGRVGLAAAAAAGTRAGIGRSARADLVPPNPSAASPAGNGRSLARHASVRRHAPHADQQTDRQTNIRLNSKTAQTLDHVQPVTQVARCCRVI